MTIRKLDVPDMKALSQTANCACFNVRKSARAVTQHFASFMNETGLKETQFSLLSVLAQAGTLPMGRLADVLLMDRTSLTRTLRPLLDKGYVEVAPGRDGRTREVQISQEGMRTLENALPHWAAAQDALLRSFGPAKWRELQQQLSNLTAAARAHTRT